MSTYQSPVTVCCNRCDRSLGTEQFTVEAARRVASHNGWEVAGARDNPRLSADRFGIDICPQCLTNTGGRRVA